MNPDIKAQWLHALRSGAYEQGQGALYKEDRYCCLGVLCALAEGEGIVQRAEEPDDAGKIEFRAVHAPYDRNPDELPSAVAKWAGLASENPDIEPDVDLDDVATGDLATLNDGGKSFTELADLIEAYL